VSGCLATFLSPFFTNIKKSVGGSTFTKWKGRNVMKAKMGKQPNRIFTPNQRQQQNFIRSLNLLWDQVYDVIKVGFKTRAATLQISEWNVFASDLNSGVRTGVAPDVVLDMSQLVVAAGTMTDTPIASIVADVSDDTVVVTWVPDVLSDHLPEDDAYLVVFNEDGTTSGSASGANRSTGTITAPLPDGIVATDTVNVYLYFTRASGVTPFISSDSVFSSEQAQA